MGDVEAAAGQFGHLNIASHGNRFGGRGHAAKTEAYRLAPLAHDRAGKQRGVFAMINHRQVKGAAVLSDFKLRRCLSSASLAHEWVL